MEAVMGLCIGRGLTGFKLADIRLSALNITMKIKLRRKSYVVFLKIICIFWEYYYYLLLELASYQMLSMDRNCTMELTWIIQVSSLNPIK